jgi:hypothetical protein
MFQDLDATLKAVLTDATAPAELRNAEISFTTPDRDFKPTQATVNLFLHALQENRTLREAGPITTRAGNGFVATTPPLRMDCTYLATAWSTRTGALKVEEEHTLLGLALAWLGRFPELEERFLRGRLKDPPQAHPVSVVVANTGEGTSISEFWSALGVTPRTTFPVTVTIGLLLSDEKVEYPQTREIETRPVLRGP